VAGVQCLTSTFGDEPLRMLRIIQRFGKHCSCHLQGECVVVGRFLKSYTGQAVGGGLYLMVLFGEAEERAAIQRGSSPKTDVTHLFRW
jgi:hypothetical protein